MKTIKEVHINTTADLMNFIKRKDVTAPQAIKVVCSVLKLINIKEKTKPEIIELTQYFIDNYFTKGCEGKPPFFENLEDEITLINSRN
jgi:hypothetical protein